jgi:hypothetical protein
MRNTELQVPTLRRMIEEAIKAAEGDERQASINVCTILQDEYDFGEEGYFDDDPELISVLTNRNHDV